MQQQIIAHVDMDCFFAACEIKKNPQLKGKPLIVGGISSRGVVSTASYEARKYGIHSAMPVMQAKKLCPHGIFVRSSKKLYSIESKKVMNILATFTSLFRQVSIDEAYLDMTEYIKQFPSWLEAAKEIRKTVFLKTGYTCSIGVAKSKKVAKIASDYKKPHGITIVYNPKRFLAPLPINKIPGIGKKSVPYYHKLGIKTIGDLAKKDTFFILDNFGQHGYSHWQLANGKNFSVINTEHRPDKSHSHEITFENDINDRHELLLRLLTLSKKVHNRIGNYLFRTVTLKIRFSDFHTITRSYTLPLATTSYQQLVMAVRKIFYNVPLKKKVRLIGVKVDNFTYTTERQLLVSDFLQTKLLNKNLTV